MTEPTPLGDGVPRRRLTPEQEARADELLADDTPETVRAEVRGLQAKARRDLFERTVPERFRGASYDDLDPTTQARDAVAGWLTSDAPTLVLVGGVGTGKTHAAYAVLADAVAHDQWVYGAAVLDLLATLRPDAPLSPIPRLSVQANVFLFDDLGAERATDWMVEQVGGILDERTREGKRQVVTTNLTAAALEERLGPRIMSRLTGGATIAQFTGKDRRRAAW